jgi:hypothetical protein
VSRFAAARRVEEIEELVDLLRAVAGARSVCAMAHVATEERAAVQLLEGERANEGDARDPCEQIDSRRIDERVHEHEAIDHVRMGGRERDCDGAAEAVATERHTTCSDCCDEIDDRLGEGVEPVCVPTVRRFLAFAEAGEVGGDEAEATREAREHRIPRDSTRQVVVKKDERSPGPRLGEADAGSTRRDVARLDVRIPASFVGHAATSIRRLRGLAKSEQRCSGAVDVPGVHHVRLQEDR